MNKSFLFCRVAKVNGKKIHQDPFKENGFNRKASDELSSDRSIPDTRHARYFMINIIGCDPGQEYLPKNYHLFKVVENSIQQP
jgi:hypothetical protein